MNEITLGPEEIQESSFGDCTLSQWVKRGGGGGIQGSTLYHQNSNVVLAAIGINGLDT